MPADMRNLSRSWPHTMSLQKLIDMQLNGFGLELFVESYWDIVAKLIEQRPEFQESDARLEFVYRGMRITLDPGPGLTQFHEDAVAKTQAT